MKARFRNWFYHLFHKPGVYNITISVDRSAISREKAEELSQVLMMVAESVAGFGFVVGGFREEEFED